jgi:riboflavin synthase
MFTGIVQGMGAVARVERGEHTMRLALDVRTLGNWEELPRGSSVAVAGVCLTVVPTESWTHDATRLSSSKSRRTTVTFDIMGETLQKTALGSLAVGDRVNVERSARYGDEIGGHVVSGHVSGTVNITNMDTANGNHVVTFSCDPAFMPYVLPKGFIALDGCSLTIVNVGSNWFTVHFIPETLTRTTFGIKGVGDPVNMEIDSMTRSIVDTVQRMQSL